MVLAGIYNTHNNWEKRPQGWEPMDFMPGAQHKSEEDEMRELVLAVERGEKIETDPEQVEAFTRALRATFNFQAAPPAAEKI